MRIWTLSDIHLEINRGWKLPSPPPDFDVLVVAGDLVPRMERGVRWLIENLPDRDVVYVAGNHESFGTDLDRTIEKARIAAAGTRIRVLENAKARIGDCEFIGARLWTDFELFGNPAREMKVAAEAMNDYRRIRTDRHRKRLRPEHTLARHRESRAFIAAELSKPPDGAKRIVVSHHACHVDAGCPGMERDPVSAAYLSDMEDDISAWGADLWIHGHTHRTDETVVIGRTRIITNGLGYGDNIGFDPTLVVDV